MKTFDEAFTVLGVKSPGEIIANFQELGGEQMLNDKFVEFVMAQGDIWLERMSACQDLTAAQALACATLQSLFVAGMLVAMEMEKGETTV